MLARTLAGMLTRRGGSQPAQQVPSLSGGCSSDQPGSSRAREVESQGARLAQHSWEGTQQQGNPGSTPGHAKLSEAPANWGAGDEQARNFH